MLEIALLIVKDVSVSGVLLILYWLLILSLFGSLSNISHEVYCVAIFDEYSSIRGVTDFLFMKIERFLAKSCFMTVNSTIIYHKG